MVGVERCASGGCPGDVMGEGSFVPQAVGGNVAGNGGRVVTVAGLIGVSVGADKVA